MIEREKDLPIVDAIPLPEKRELALERIGMLFDRALTLDNGYEESPEWMRDRIVHNVASDDTIPTKSYRVVKEPRRQTDLRENHGVSRISLYVPMSELSSPGIPRLQTTFVVIESMNRPDETLNYLLTPTTCVPYDSAKDLVHEVDPDLGVELWRVRPEAAPEAGPESDERVALDKITIMIEMYDQRTLPVADGVVDDSHVA